MTMTSTLSRTSAERKSIAMLRLSIQPSSRSRCEKAAIRSRSAAGLAATMNPIVGSFGVCCARRERPRGRAAEQGDELTPPQADHATTSQWADHGILSLQWARRLVLGADLNCSESSLQLQLVEVVEVRCPHESSGDTSAVTMRS